MVGPLQILEMVTPRYFPLSTTPADVHARCMLFAEAVVCWRFEWPCTFSGGNSSATSTPIPLMLRDHPVTNGCISLVPDLMVDQAVICKLSGTWIWAFQKVINTRYRSGTGVVPGQFPVVPLRGHPVVKMYAPPEQLIGFYDLGSH